MQKLYGYVFNYVFKITAKAGDKVRNAGLVLCCAFLVWKYFFTSDIESLEGIGAIVVSLMLLLSINTEMKPVRWNKWLYYPMVLFGLGILLVELIHPVGYGFTMYAVDLVILFPAFYYVWNNRGDHRTLYNIIAFTVLAAGIISFCYCVYLACNGDLIIREARVCGHKTNANIFGMMGVAILMSGLYFLAGSKERIYVQTLAAAGTGIGISYVAISISRTSMLAASICVITFIVMLCKRRKQEKSENTLKAVNIVAVILAIVITMALGFALNDINSTASGSAEVSTEADSDTAETDEAAMISERMGAEGKDADTLSSGRASIWGEYVSHLSWFGRPFTELLGDLEGLYETRAHNNFLEYYYRCGYIVGSISLLLFLGIGIAGLRMLIKKECCRPEDTFVVMVIGTYSVYAMLEISMLPFIRLIPWLFFISISPVMTLPGETERQ